MPPVELLFLIILVPGLAVDAMIAARLALRLDGPWRPRVQRLRERPWDVTRTFLAFSVFLLSQVGVALAAHGLADGRPTPLAGAVWHGLLVHLPCLLAVAVLVARTTRGWPHAFGMSGPALAASRRPVLFAYLGTVPILLGTNLWYHALLHRAGVPTPPQEILVTVLQTTGLPARAYLVFLALVSAPLVEEILFRGILLPFLLRVASPVTAVIAVSVLFASLHVHLPSFAVLFVLSVLLCLAYIRTGSLWTPVLVHAVFNGVNLVLAHGASTALTGG